MDNILKMTLLSEQLQIGLLQKESWIMRLCMHAQHWAPAIWFLHYWFIIISQIWFVLINCPVRLLLLLLLVSGATYASTITMRTTTTTTLTLHLKSGFFECKCLFVVGIYLCMPSAAWYTSLRAIFLPFLWHFLGSSVWLTEVLPSPRAHQQKQKNGKCHVSYLGSQRSMMAWCVKKAQRAPFTLLCTFFLTLSFYLLSSQPIVVDALKAIMAISLLANVIL